ncbi:MAG: hypothetical protein FD161_426 [Limisphaerales bacterium]|nr:MAG: hypothetical protein FD161_426 [Limisphaerales bacterium]KAG0510331.1 MAG: hypothetical protein E1N63_426 [Limisphaerales bacterium]TXT51518.1 MAG: hypothetical protein FD140_1556 [Limisphaerales bacterium]
MPEQRGYIPTYMKWRSLAEPGPAMHFAAWDGAFYLHIEEFWYRKGADTCAFYPLLPALIKITSLITFDNSLFAGLLLTNTFSVLAALMLYALALQLHGERVAIISVLILLSHPGALFLSFIYTESLFLFLSLSFFFCLFNRRFGWVAILGVLLPLTKAVGIFCLVPLAYSLWEKKENLKQYWVLLTPILGYAIYLLIMYCSTGNAFEGFKAQQMFPSKPMISNIFDLPKAVNAFLSPLELHGMLNSALDRGMFIFFIASLYLMFKHNRALFVYGLVIGLVPALAATFMSYSRNVLMCFPMIFVIALFLKDEAMAEIRWFVIAILLAIQACLLVRYIHFGWAG